MVRYSGILNLQEIHEENSLTSKDIRKTFLKLLTQRAPASVLWYGLISPEEFKWPEWSQTAFTKERNDWLALSRLTADRLEGEVQHWGRFSRLAANRIAQEGWRSPLAPIKTLRTSLWVLWLMNAQDADIDWHAVVLQAANWLHSLTDQSGGDFFVRAMLQDECEDIKRWTGVFLAGRNLTQEMQSLHLALDDYCIAIQRKKSCVTDVPWATSAHVDTWEWHSRRADFRPRPYYLIPSWSIRELTENFPTGMLPPTGKDTVKALQYVPVPTLGPGSWIRTHPNPVLFYGPKAEGSLICSRLYLWWVDYSNPDPLSLLLTAPPILESVLYALISCLPQNVPDGWTQWKKNRLQTMEMLALSDAWMWLEGGEPNVVKTWLETILGPRLSAWWVLRLKTNPSYALMVQTLADQILDQCQEQGYDWWGFARGPNIFMLP